MSKQTVLGFLNLLSPNAFVYKHSPNSKGIHLCSSGTSHFWNKTFLGMKKSNNKQNQTTQISSRFRSGQVCKKNLD